MGLDLWFKQDVARILASQAQTAARYPGKEYKEGYLDALSDLAVAFGLAAPQAGSGPGWDVIEAESSQHNSLPAYQQDSIPDWRRR